MVSDPLYQSAVDAATISPSGRGCERPASIVSGCATLPYAINLMLDPEATLQVERVYASLASLNIRDDDLVTQYGSCMTILVVSDSIHMDDLDEIVKRAIPAALPITLTEPCLIHGLPPTLCLRIAPTNGLLAIHHAIYRALPEQAVHLHYRPAYWQPQLKLANVRAEHVAAAALVAAVAERWTPTAGRLEALEIVHYPPVQAMLQVRLRRAA